MILRRLPFRVPAVGVDCFEGGGHALTMRQTIDAFIRADPDLFIEGSGRALVLERAGERTISSWKITCHPP